MDAKAQDEVTPLKVAQYNTNYSLCIICQKTTAEALVKNTSVPLKLLECIRDRSKYCDGKYPEISRRLGQITIHELETQSATWHRKCYQNTVHAGMCSRAKARYEKTILDTKISSQSHACGSGTFTRSKSTPYKKDLCFFCDKEAAHKAPLHKIATDHAGQALKKAIGNSCNETLKVKLNTSLVPEDAHAIDIRYHLKCWAKHVLSVNRNPSSSDMPKQYEADETAAEVEFISLVEHELHNGKRPDMSSLEESYNEILSGNNVKSPVCDHKKLKQILQNGISDVEFRAQSSSEVDCVILKQTKESTLKYKEDPDVDINNEMKILYNAASILRKAIGNAEKWKFSGSFSDVSEEHVPQQLYSFFRLVLQGPKTCLSSDKKSSEVSRNAMTLSETTVTMFLNERQVKNKKSVILKSTREMPQQLAVGIALRQAIRSKKIINMLHGFGVSVEYNRLLRLEGQIASTVLKRILLNDNIFLPPDIILGRRIFFAVDNVDFAEDTPDGKRTTHATVMAIYQQHLEEDLVSKLELLTEDCDHTIKDLPSTV